MLYRAYWAQISSLCVQPMGGFMMTQRRGRGAHRGNTNRIGMGRRAPPILCLAPQAIGSHASQG